MLFTIGNSKQIHNFDVLMMYKIFVGMKQLKMVMVLIKLIKVRLRALREVAVADVTGTAPGRELFTHL